MDSSEIFRAEGHKIVDWIADYYNNIEKYPVKASCKPGSIFSAVPVDPPDAPEDMKKIFGDFERIILPGITHWQSPGFFAYFPANTSFPSILAEMLTAAMGAQGMKWETSPAATELEEAVMNWLKKMTGLPDHFQGVIQDTASTATLCAILSAREKHTRFMVNQAGLFETAHLRVYCSSEAHSSVEKAIKIAGIGKDNLVKIATDKDFRMQPRLLEEALSKDISKNLQPVCVVAALPEIAAICEKYKVWLHVDAAYAGSALILPEFRWMIRGIEKADSLVFNPHKWLFTNFDCSAYFVKDAEILTDTFKLVPEYLKTQIPEHVNDYSNWGIQLGRRFRALKLWFVIRSYGVSGLQEKLRKHIALAHEFKLLVEQHEEYELLAPVLFSLVCFRFHPKGNNDNDSLNRLNEQLLLSINATGSMYISHTKLNGIYTLRMSISQTHVDHKHVINAWRLITEMAEILKNK
jgi:aromatic-L-amino-acid decarboxylase